MTVRLDGHYWVRLHGYEFTVGRLVDGQWFLPGTAEPYTDEDMAEVEPALHPPLPAQFYLGDRSPHAQTLADYLRQWGMMPMI